MGEQLNTGVANFIQQTQGAIGYVEYAYSLQAGFTNAALKNQAGSFVTPSQSSIAAAGAQATIARAPANFNIIDGAGRGHLPAGQLQLDAALPEAVQHQPGVVLGQALRLGDDHGPAQAAALGYSPLPANVVTLAHQTLLQLQNSSGKALFTG